MNPCVRVPSGVLVVISALSLAWGAPLAVAVTPAQVKASEQPAWVRLTDAERKQAGDFAARYMRFLASARIPLQRSRYLAEQAASAGFRSFEAHSGWSPGFRYYLVNRERALLLLIAGKKPLKEGVRLIGAHLDSPRLDLRPKPIKGVDPFVLFTTAPYGGIKRYQWANLPLALVGQVARADGKLLTVSIGDRPDDPVFMLPDLAPHVDKDFRGRPTDMVFKGDELSAIAASLPGGGSASPKQALLEELHRRYGISEEDLISAELSLVPANPPREVGLDRALIGGYGQDDGLCSFAATGAAIALSGTPTHTTVVYLVDHEEVGNTNTTGVRSRFLEATLSRLLMREAKGETAPADALSSLYERSQALSADVSHAANPLFPSTEDPLNTAKVGHGMTLKGMRPGFDGSPALRARLRGLLTKNRIPWQTYAYKVDGGGGATIGADLQVLNMDVVDVGAPVLAMHGTFELASKADLFALHRFFGAFLQSD